jgi:hypothetical protein
MALDSSKTVSAVSHNGMPVPVSLSDIIDAAVGDAALAPTGTTATADELNTLHGVTAGTTLASGALVVDANKQLDALNVTALGLGSGRVAVTATAAELNTLHSVTAGTAAASKALVVDANKQLDALNVTTLGLGAGRVAQSGAVRAGRHTATSGEASAHTMAIASGLTTILFQSVQILRSGADVTGDAAISVSAGTITVADGASTYAVTAGDVINWIAVGS